MAIEYLDRPPRIQPELPVGEVQIPKPPEEGQGLQNSLLTQVLPMVGTLGFLLSSASGNLLMVVIMGFTMGLTFVVAIFANRNAKKQLEAQKKEYSEALAAMRQDMERTHNNQRIFYNHNYPSAPALLDIAARTDNSRFGARLWERRTSDADFGSIRLGMGTRASTFVYKADPIDELLEKNLLRRDAYRLAQDSALVTNVPITVPLRHYKKEGEARSEGSSNPAATKGMEAHHTIGIFGKNPTNTADFARAILANFTAFHSPHDARLYVLGLPQNKGSWQWCDWMPHCIDRGIGDDDADLDKPKEHDQICFAPEKDKILAFWKRLKKELDQRQVRLRDTSDEDRKKGGTDVTLPMILVVVDLLGDVPAGSPLGDVASESVVATINSNGPTLGAAIIFLASDPGKIPSDCQAMIEVAAVGGGVSFRYTEVGLNTPRYIGEVDTMTAADARQKFAARLRRLDLRRPLGADLPRSVDMLQMQSVVEGRRINTVDKLTVKENWEYSMIPKNSEWLRVPVGMVSLRDARELIFSAKEGGDGVHGMIAGTTGSGKSELLLTLVAGMAIKYDPRIVNFVLVDYKGGAAFEPFKKLPHVVDILTNLQASAVERMFVAVGAVMDQRSVLLARSNMKDLVDYRQKTPFVRDPSLPKTFPHLFIIVDEFAEMITQNPDYKAKFESVTRLGRAFGVTLILATQRPAGVVTDQMRANMKFRICLRVETSEDSKELLARPDAAFLANIGGRGYIQVGNDILQGVQMARAGGDYSDDRTTNMRDVIWLDDEAMPQQGADQPLYSPSELAEALGMKPGEKPGTLVDWIVGICALRAKRDGIPLQKKPWPSPLPEFLSLTEPIDAEYLNTERALDQGNTIVINEGVNAWLNNTEEKPLWKPMDWKANPALKVEVGLVDNPYLAEQQILTLDLSAGPMVVFGSAGKGKTTFIKTLLLALGAARSPNEVHMYAFDFGRGVLKAIKAIPHLGATIDSSETTRVDQMIRMLRNFANERQERLANYNSLADHNIKNPTQAFAEIVVVIYNFGEFKDSFEHLMPDLMALIRDGRAFGMYFVITANNMQDVSGKLYNLFTQRLTFTLPDRSVYADIVGRGAPNFDNVPGRGLVPLIVKDDFMPLEFQIGLPGVPTPPGEVDNVDEYQDISQRMEKVWFAMGGKRPSAELPRALTLLDMFTLIDNRPITTLGDLQIAEKWKMSMLPEKQEWLRGAIGLISSKEIRTMYFQAQADGVHGMAAGTTGSGKSELIQTLISAMAIRYDPRIVNFVLVDYKGGPTVEPFRKLPHCVDIATNLDGNAVERIFIAINAEMNRRSDILAKAGVSDLVEYRKKVIPGLKPDSPFPTTFPHLFIIVDEFAEMMTVNPEYKGKFESITRLGRSFGVSLILATQRPAGVVSDQMRSNMKFRICLRVETPEDSKELLKRPDAARLPQIGGRGYVQAGTDLLTEVQAAWSGAPYDGTKVADPVYPADEILTVLDKKSDPPRSVLGWLVGAMAAEAKRQGIPKQFKPWPDNLPENLPINLPVDASYLPEVAGDKIILNPAITTWATVDPNLDPKEHAKLWQPWDWDKPLPMKASFGIVDDPFHSNQRVLTLDVSGDPIVVFGGSGRGKTTFLKSLLLSLAAQRSPGELNMYALDFGRGGLKSIKFLPHCGATIDASQPERVGQLFRMIRSLMNERQEALAKYASLEDYNSQHKDSPELLFPAVIFAIDNFAEFKESYEPLMAELIGMVRDGRAFGIYYIITASSMGDLPGKLYNILATRATFTLPDASVYGDIVGRGSLPLTNAPGRGLINVEGQPLEFQVAIPIVENDKDPYTRIAQRMETAWFAIGGKRPAAEIPRAITLLEMYQIILAKKVERIGDLNITANWKKSMLAENQEWLSGPIGLVSSKEIRNMMYTAKAGGDGVHGMAAGTTGSGKSELIQTLICGLAIKYDPRIVNFVLVDYKGGPTVEPFRKLPHAVDIATNLDGNAVERIFIAINAEMSRRSDILAKAGVADLVEYRKKVIPTLRPDSPFPRTFPHLFVIVDEFAEMMVQNPEYKGKFESITRLGRSFGVTLILATQRPSGVVSDQMRSNMKFRICLRVETNEDSKEMLGRPDGATLPAIGGRGYVQVGGGPLTEVQAAWSGAPYDETRPDPVYSTDEILDTIEKRLDPPRSLLGWLVGAMATEAKRQGIPKQFKPWPDNLPNQLPLNMPVDANYIHEGNPTQAKTLILNQSVADWVANTEAKALWKPHDWLTPLPLHASIGIIDDPFHSDQKLMDVNIGGDPIVLFGASGKGKTTFLKSLLLSLAAQRAPSELHIFALDFGRGGLKAIKALPHCGATIDASQPERVAQLFRMLRSIMTERQEKLAKYASMEDYNSRFVDNPEALFPATIIAIDNFAEFKENYENMLPDLQALIRDGRAFGIYYIVTANVPQDLNAKLLNLMTTRYALTLSDPSIYSEIVGRGAVTIANVPGRGLVAVDGQPLEFHVAIPMIENEKDAYTRLAERMEKAWFATGGKRPAAEIPRAITFLEMYQTILSRKIDRIGELDIAGSWRKSMLPENQEWLSAPIGLVSSKEVRTMLFSAKAGGDGVHGMAAGTTGSGKSELIQTLISALAIKYDPRIVNFVLVDYKGGPTVEPFRQLPHAVDIATNLDGNAVDRIFVAINAEMNRRSSILAQAGVADLVEYRKKVIPTLRPESPLPRTFPHLFMIVDEFAEMVTQNPDYKAKFESITRLGRSFGVTLILATQRPSGVVTDQMRSNMKFRICLRVETADDSKEMLGRADGSALPAIGGRGYVQVGGGQLTEVQAAWSGAPYDETKADPIYSVDEILETIDKKLDPPRSLLGWLVGAMATEAKRQGIPKQFKPWPDPLPKNLPINKPVNAEYMAGAKQGDEVVINPAVTDWMANTDAKPIWQRVDWKSPTAFNIPVGILDNPYLAQQSVMTIKLLGDPIAVFGASGRGKSTLLKSLVLSIAAKYSPSDVHIMALDFGRGGLKALRPLPHMAGIVEVNEEERVERLMRVARAAINDRQQKLQAYDSFIDYNIQHPDAPMPILLVLIDNVSEFRELYERYQMELIALVRDGRSFGVFFVATASLTGDMPMKLFSVMTQRFTFTQNDPSDYSNIVGRGWTRINDEPGRGLTQEVVGETPMPLEFHAAIPLGDEDDETDYFRELPKRMAKAWATVEAQSPEMKARKPQSVEPLATVVDLNDLLPALGGGKPKQAVPLGINDIDREPTVIDFAAKGPHLIVIGPPVTGKTTLVRSLTLALAHSYSPEQAALILIDPADPSRRFFNFGGNGDNRLDKLPHVLATVSDVKELDQVIKRLKAEYDEPLIARLQDKSDVFRPQNNQARTIYVIVDHYDDAESVFNKKGPGLGALADIGKGKNMSFVISGSLNIMRSSSDEFRRRAEGSRYTMVINDFETVRYMGARGNFSPGKEPPPGRGYLIKAVTASMVQVATPYLEGKNGLTAEEQLDSMIGAIREKYPQQAQWSYFGRDLTVLTETIAAEETEPEEETATNPYASNAEQQAAASAARSALEEAMKLQAQLMAAAVEIPDPDPADMVVLEIPDKEPEANGNGNGNGNGAGGNGHVPEAEAVAVGEGDGAERKEKKAKKK